MSELIETTNLSAHEESVLVAITREQLPNNEPVSKAKINRNLNNSIFNNSVATGIALLHLAKKDLIASKMIKAPGSEQPEEHYELSDSGKEWVLTNEKLFNTETNSIF